MTTIRRVLLATDFSKSCDTAVQWAERLRLALDAEQLDVVHVYDPAAFELPAPYGAVPGVDAWVNQHLSGMAEQGRSALDDLVPTLAGQCHGVFLEGRPGPAIVDYAEQHDVDLIIVGTHGHKGFSRLVMGSVSAYVVRHAPCPVLTVKPEQMPGE